tara:strand:- start:141 stop:434 length:294 start_codon:yes stop_codon:yes gene_type:complete
MTDSPVEGELFTRDGSVGQISVEPKDNSANGDAANVVFVPVAEPRERMSFATFNDDPACLAEANKKLAKAPYDGFLSDRIAKVKRHTADLFQQTKKL